MPVIGPAKEKGSSVPKFFNDELAKLTHELTISPRRLRCEQIEGIERLLGLLSPDKAYPFEFVCHTITQYRKRGPGMSDSLLPGKALVVDLITMAEIISRKACLTIDEIKEPCQTQHEVAEQLHVSTKTVRRWRDRGLMGIRVVYKDGINRLAFCRSTVERFARQNRSVVEKGAAFTQLSLAERERLVELARDIIAERPIKLHAVARRVAEQTGRAVETIRYTLRRFDEANPDAPLFDGDGSARRCERHVAMWGCYQAGESVESIAEGLACSVKDVECVLASVQLSQWRELPPQCIHNELFDAPNASDLILAVPEPALPEGKPARVPKDLPPYLASLYLTPLLTRELEADLFRRFNFLKHKAACLIDSLALDDSGTDGERAGGDVANGIAEVCALLARAEEFKKRIIQANLRLVVSIAKKHMGRSSNFFEIVSDGNMSLMRAVEKFDYARGNKFSTYASWAIMKNYARSIPEQHYHGLRYVTGQDQVLEVAPEESTPTAHASDRERVRELIEESLGGLSEREREIVRGHFGLVKGGAPQTLEQLGRRFGVTKERVRQIEKRALAQLRGVLAPSLVDALT